MDRAKVWGGDRTERLLEILRDTVMPPISNHILLNFPTFLLELYGLPNANRISFIYQKLISFESSIRHSRHKLAEEKSLPLSNEQTRGFDF